MRSIDTQAWMLDQALDLLQSADRLQRQYFRITRAGAGPCWEPPVDLVRHGRQLHLLVALPGVPADRFAVHVEGRAIVVRGERALGDKGADAILRLEIPYGRFERRIELPDGSYRLLEMKLEDGCLRIALEPAP